MSSGIPVGIRLVKGGVDVLNVQKRLRHAKASTTLDYYCQNDESVDEPPACVMAPNCSAGQEGGRGTILRPCFGHSA